MSDGELSALLLEHPQAAASLTRLYLVTYGRVPDLDGLTAFSGALAAGRSLAEIASEFVESDEFGRQEGSGTAIERLHRNALGTEPRPGVSALGFLAAALATRADVVQRLDIMPMLFPDGIALDDRSYRLWVQEVEREMPPPPRSPDPRFLSCLVVLDGPEAGLLEAAIDSVLGAGAGTELLLGWSGRPSPKDADAVAALARSRPNLRVVRGLPFRSGAGIRNGLLRAARGTFVTLLGQHDRLVPGAADAICAGAAGCDVVTADEDVLGADGQRCDPCFSGAWDAEAVTCSERRGLVVMRRSVLRELGGLRAEAGACGEWDLLLRAVARVGAPRIRHVPQVLCSRQQRGQAAGSGEARRRIVGTYLALSGSAGCTATCDGPGEPVRVVRPLPVALPPVSVIIPTRDRLDLLRCCLGGVLAGTEYAALEVIIVDNDSREEATRAFLAEVVADPRVRVLHRPGPFNWSRLNNEAVRTMRGEVAVFLNNDVEVTGPGWLRELASQAIRPPVGVVGARLLYPDDTIQHAGIVLGPEGRSTHVWRHVAGTSHGYMDQLCCVRQVGAVTGACLATRRDVLERTGGFEEEHLKVTWNDVDYCLRARRLGLGVIWTPHATLKHHEQASRGTDETPEAKARLGDELEYMRGAWGDALDFDPFWSPNLHPAERRVVLASRVGQARKAGLCPDPPGAAPPDPH